MNKISETIDIELENIVISWLHKLALRDRETEEHTCRVATLTLQLANLIGIPDSKISALWCGAMLHDIGKLAIPDYILLKPTQLSKEEWDVMRRHPRLGADMIKSNPHLTNAIDIPLYHHEKWDGSGYPSKIKGEAIPLSARIFAFADVYDALTSERPYRSAWEPEDALHYILQKSGTHFDPSITPVFASMFTG